MNKRLAMKLLFILLLCLHGCCFAAFAQRDSLLVAFWNLENFFTPDSPFRPEYWTKGRFSAKCNAVAKTILYLSEECGRLPDAVGFAEVENSKVLELLVSRTVLRKLDYAILHFDSHDPRGIDCALIYRKSRLHLRKCVPLPIVDSFGDTLQTRDILLAEFDSMAILVNHHPSRIGGKAERRDMAMRKMRNTADSLVAAGCMGVLAIGDFNEAMWPGNAGSGTIKYNGRWEKIDGHFAFGGIRTAERILDYPFLLTRDSSYGGQKPLRTFTGPRYQGGVSDHLPIAVDVYF